MKIRNYFTITMDTEAIDEAMRKRLTAFADGMLIITNGNQESTTDKNRIYEVTRKFNDRQLDCICSYVWGTHSAVFVYDFESGLDYVFVNDKFSEEGKEVITLAIKGGDAFNVKFKAE